MPHSSSPADRVGRAPAPAPAPLRQATAAPRGVISRSTASAARQLLHALGDGRVLDDRIRRAARMVAGDARRRGLSADQMLVALKREWPGPTGGPRIPDGDHVRDLARRLVTLCIHEFYASRAAHGPGAVHACRVN
jgi:hypothetical protein